MYFVRMPKSEHVYMCYLLIREHDKGPEEFCAVLLKLVDVQLPFKVSVLGSHTNDIPGLYEYTGLSYY